MIYFFAVTTHLLPPSGFVPFGEDPWLNLQSVVMPTFVIGTHSAGFLARHVRSSLLEVYGQDFIRTARAKGVSESTIVLKHAARPAAIPVVTVIGLAWGHFMAGSFLVEYVFALPGLGRMGVEAIFAKDFPVIQVTLMAVAVNVLLANLVVDILYGTLDPRVRAPVSAPAPAPVGARALGRALIGHRLALAWALIIVAAVHAAWPSFAPLLAPHDPYKQNLYRVLQSAVRPRTGSAPITSGAIFSRA